MNQYSNDALARFSSFDVRYSPVLSSTKHANRLGLSGGGEIAFTADGIHLRGKKNRFFGFGTRVDFCFQPQQTQNLVRTGKMLRFEIVSPESKNLSMQLWAKNEAVACKIQQALPSTHTPEFAARQAEAADFKARLDAVGGQTWVTPTLVAINIAVFAACALSGGGVLKPNLHVLTQWGTNFGPLTLTGQWWRLFTSMFLHFGLLHLAFNMWALYIGGRLVEKLYGSTSFLLLYFGAGLCGSLASLLWHPAGNSAGASGAIMGVYGAMLVYFLRKDTLVPSWIIAQQRNSVLVFVGYNLLAGVSHQGIDNAAHIGGLLGGAALGLSMIRPLDVERRAASGVRHWAQGTTVAITLLASLGYTVAHPNADRMQELKVRSDIQWIGEQEIAVDHLYRDEFQKYKAGTISPPQFANLIERDVLPRWDEIMQRITNDRLPAESGLQETRNSLIAYCDSRQETFKFLDSYLRGGGADALKKGNAKIEESKRELKTFLDLYKKVQ